MVNLTENGIACECGSQRLAASGSSVAIGGLCICASCGKTFRLALKLEAIDWATCALSLSDVDYVAFGWTLRGLSNSLQLRALQRRRLPRWPDRAGALLGAVMITLLVLVAARAVWS